MTHPWIRQREILKIKLYIILCIYLKHGISLVVQICTPDLVVFLACSNQRLKERLEKRAEQQGRPDDNPKATERRLANFKQNAVPLVKYFQEKGLIVTVRRQKFGFEKVPSHFVERVYDEILLHSAHHLAMCVRDLLS